MNYSFPDTPTLERKEVDHHQQADHGENPSSHRNSGVGHGLLMLVVCGAVLISVLMIAWVGDGRFGNAYILLLLLCPILHMVLHRGHEGHNHS